MNTNDDNYKLYNFALKFTPKDKEIIHFIGIGGIGFSGLALILHKLGYKVQGSDLSENYNITRLKKYNIKVFIGHDALHVQNANLIIISNVIKEDNPELLEVNRLNLTTYTKGDILQFLIEKYKDINNTMSIAVTGAHGKTTTTCLLEEIFSGANKVNLFFAGGVVKKLNTNAYVNNLNQNTNQEKNINDEESTYNKDKFSIIEADESDNTCFNIKPNILIITNVDKEHLDFYKNFDILLQKFKNIFQDSINYQAYRNISDKNLDKLDKCIDKNLDKLDKCKQYRNLNSIYENLIICLDDKYLRDIYNAFNSNKENINHIITYGIENINSDIIAKNIIYQDNCMTFKIQIQTSFFNKIQNKFQKESFNLMQNILNSYQDAQFKMQIIGKHNVLNALSCIVAAILAKIPFLITKQKLLSFEGAKRRFNLICNYNGIDIIDDYAHHPTEIKATILAAKQKYKNIAVVVEIHKYSRLYELYNEFIDALQEVPYAILIPIHTAGELNLYNIDHYNLKDSLNAVYLQKNNKYICKTIEIELINDAINSINNTKENIINDIMNFNSKIDCILFMGAGTNITKLANSYNIYK
ncbi:MAG: Mur ligase domain-containing protein [Rickettsiales bacterium]